MMESTGTREEPFPAPSKQATGTVNGIATEVSCINFADKIVLTISQDGRLSQWVGSGGVVLFFLRHVLIRYSRSKFLSRPRRQLSWRWLCQGLSYLHCPLFT